MKNFPLKKILLSIVIVGIAVGGIFYFTNTTGKKPASGYINPAFGEYITSYTAGVVP